MTSRKHMPVYSCELFFFNSFESKSFIKILHFHLQTSTYFFVYSYWSKQAFPAGRIKALEMLKSTIFSIQWDFSKGIHFQCCPHVKLVIWYLLTVLYSFCNAQTGRHPNAAIHEWKAVSKMLSQMEIFYSRMKIYFGIRDRVLVQVCCDSATHLQESSNCWLHHEKWRKFLQMW